MKRTSFSHSAPVLTRSINKLLLAVVGVSSFTIQTPAWSQGVLEEVVVTARKREESLQETPIAVTAFSGRKMEEAGIRNISDFNEVVPNIDVGAGSGNAGVANIYIRGVGQRNTEPNLDSGVATYIDGVYVGRADGALLDVNDIQSVQVLRGPQGTLFGKNATGGAMVFNTNRPGPELEGGLTLRMGNYDQQDAEGYINIPLIEDLLYTRLSMVSKQQDGYVYNVVDGKDYNDTDRISGVWQVRWMASDDITVDFNANYGKTAQTTRLQKCVVVPEALDRAWQTNLSNLGLKPAYNRDIIEFCKDSQNLNTYEATSDLGRGYDAENQGFSTTIDWSLTDTMSLKSITAWRGTKASQNDDLDQLAIPLLHRSNDSNPIAQWRDTDQYSQELQLLGDSFDGRLAWVTGIFAFQETTGNSRTVNDVGPHPYLPPRDNTYFYTTFATDLEVDNEAYSAFAQADYSISENWVVTAGLRYTYEKRELTKSLYAVDLDSFALPPATVESYVGGAVLQLTEPNAFNPNYSYILDPANPEEKLGINDNAWTPLISLKYLIPEGDIINGGSVYFTYSQGYRSGGLSEAPRPFDVATQTFGASIEEFKPEQVDNYELGIKIDTWDNRLRVNASVFQMDYTDRQLTTIVFDVQNGIPGGATINAAESTISGIELETTILPIEGLEVTVNATWNRGEIDEYEDIQILGTLPLDVRQSNCDYQSISGLGDISICNIDRSDEDLPRLPKRAFLLALQYTWDTDYGVITPRIQGSWKFDQNGSFDRTSWESGVWDIDKQTNISARLSWLSPDQQWRVSAFGTNLTKEDYSTGGTALPDALGYGGQTYATPRMVGAEVQYTF
jgi:iron complex outermembrane receptor protein